MNDQEFLADVVLQLDAKLRDMEKAQEARVDGKLGLAKKEQEAALLRFRQGLSRGPGSGAPDLGAFQRRPSAGLAQDTNFATWLASTRSRKSSFACELPFEIKAAPVTGVGLPYPYTQVIGAPQPALRLAQVMFHVPVTSGAVVFTEETSFVPGADIVPEGGLKPGTTLTFLNKTATVATIATIAKASVQSINDTPALATWIDERLSYSVLLRQEGYILNDPTTGLLTVATAATAPPAGSTMLDAIALAEGELSAIGFTPDAAVMNPSDVTLMRLVKSTTGEYLWADPDSPVGTSAVWNLPLVASPSMPKGEFLVGAFSQSTLLFDRQLLTIEISYENEDDFIHNLACFRAELRCAAAVPLPQGLVKGTFAVGVAGSLAQQPHVRK